MKSLLAFEENLNSTDLFTARVHAMSTYLKPKRTIEYPSSIPPEIHKFLMFDEAHFEKIFELGFIALFANFEHFMYEFLKELYTKQPKAIPPEKTIKAGDLMEFKSYRNVRDYLIDTIAIENSYDIETWNNTSQKLFNIKPIPDEIRVRIMIMNSMRNMFLHSGGHWNSKIYKDKRKIERALNSKEPIKVKSKKEAFKTAKSALTPKTAYSTTIQCFRDIIKEIKSELDNKNNRKKKITNIKMAKFNPSLL
jgi:hypothetical protein